MTDDPRKTELERLHHRLRSIRESKRMTLQAVAEQSQGSISAIALGSYERGDRSVSAAKLIEIADLYGVPVTELFTSQEKIMEGERTTFDLRKLRGSIEPKEVALEKVLSRIIALRRDWNGELLSLRSTDIGNFAIFSGVGRKDVEMLIKKFSFIKLK